MTVTGLETLALFAGAEIVTPLAGVYVKETGFETLTAPVAFQLFTMSVCWPGATCTQVLVEKFCAPLFVAQPEFGYGYELDEQLTPSM